MKHSNPLSAMSPLWTTLKYGESAKELAQAWDAGEDFKIYGGPYFSIRDIDKIFEIWDVIIINTPNGDILTIEKPTIQ